MKDIGNTLGKFIKVAEQTKVQRYTSFSSIYVYMDLSKELLEAISLNWEDEEWIQTIDYEKLPFWCWHCHDYGHLRRTCPKLSPGVGTSDQRQEKETEMDGFTQVKNRRRSKGSGRPNAKKE